MLSFVGEQGPELYTLKPGEFIRAVVSRFQPFSHLHLIRHHPYASARGSTSADFFFGEVLALNTNPPSGTPPPSRPPVTNPPPGRPGVPPPANPKR